VSIDEKKKPLEWKGKEVEFLIDNQNKTIILTRGTRSLLKGKEVSKFYSAISPDDQQRMEVKAKDILRRGRIRYYLVYELVSKGQERMPMLKNQRAFLAAEVYSETFSKKNAQFQQRYLWLKVVDSQVIKAM
jgi:hypothetical protein